MRTVSPEVKLARWVGRLSTSAVVGVVLFACRSAGSPVATDASPDASPLSSLRQADSGPARVPEASAVGGVAITNLGPGRFEIETGTPTRLATVATIEKQLASGSWSAFSNLDLGMGYRLVEACGEAAPSCVDLAPGRPLHPVPFSGLSCSSQCNPSCDKNVWIGPGWFRLVVDGCEPGAAASNRAVGMPFELPDHRSARSLLRWGLATDARRAAAMRLDLPPKGGWEPAAKPANGRVAGLVERPGTERGLDAAAFDALLALLRDDKGYDDVRAKRCAVGTVVGARLYRLPASTAPRDETAFESVELAFDFRCQTLVAVLGGADGRPRAVHATYFDPSRAAWVAFAKRALPDDAELRALK